MNVVCSFETLVLIYESIWHHIESCVLIYLLTAIELTPGGSSTLHIYSQTIRRTTQLTTWLEGFLGFEPRVVKLKLMMN
jgi:uncharacterized integral membrane protein